MAPACLKFIFIPIKNLSQNHFPIFPQQSLTQVYIRDVSFSNLIINNLSSFLFNLVIFLQYSYYKPFLIVSTLTVQFKLHFIYRVFHLRHSRYVHGQLARNILDMLFDGCTAAVMSFVAFAFLHVYFQEEAFVSLDFRSR